MNSLRNIFFLALAVFLMLGNVAYGDDTDIYLTPSTVSRDDSPNVLLILDDSGSMKDQVQTASPYSSSTTYTYAGSGTAFSTNEIYWIDTTKGQIQPTSATSYPNQYFSTTNNLCSTSSSSLTNYGYYNDKAASWNSSTGWQALTTTDLPVECKADNPADTSGTYAEANKWISFPQTSPQYISNGRKALGGGTGSNYFNGYDTYTFYTGNYLNYLSTASAVSSCTMGGTPDAYYNYSSPDCPSKMQLAKDAVKSIIDANPNVRFGLMTYNYDAPHDTNSDPNGGRVAFAIQDMTSTAASNLDGIVDSLVPSTNTPLAETLYEAYRYLGGNSVLYGNSTNPTTPAADANAQDGSGNYKSPFLYSCQQAYIILITDGDPTLDQNADQYIKLLPGIGTPTHQIYDIYSGQTYYDYLDVLAGWLYNNDIDSAMGGTQRAVTYPIGFTAGNGISSQGIALLQSVADLGQGKSAGQGLYTSASNGSALAAALQSAIIDIQQTTSSFAAPALSVNAFNRLFNRDDVYFAMFKPSTSVEWNGNVKKFKLDSSNNVVDANGALAIDPVTQRIKDTAQSYWSSTVDGGTITQGGAGANIPSPSSRTMYTYIGTYPISSPVDLSLAANQFTDSNTAITSTMLGLPTTATATDRTNLINWVRGQDSYNSLDPTGQRWAFSDPLHSRPVAITFGGNNSNPIIKLFVATNDGVIHMINDSTGVEEWSFIPQEVLGMQYELSQNGSGTHPYGVDGTPTFYVIDNNNNGIIEPANGDKVYMFIGMRQGGRNIYAFDVTPTSTITSATAVGGIVPKLMWVIRGGVDADFLQLGYTWSSPQVRQISVNCNGSACTTGDTLVKTVLIFGGGYDPHQDTQIPTGPDYIAGTQQGMGNAIYIVDPITGQRIWWASGGPDSAGNSPTLTVTGMNYSIASDLTLLDTNGDGMVDRIYAPDTGGNIWRIDLGANLDLNTNAGSVGYEFASVSTACSSTDLQDCRKFFYPPDYLQVTDSNYSSTADYDMVTIESGDRQDPLDKQTVGLTTPVDPVHNRIYAFRDYQIGSLAGTTGTLPSAITEANMYDATADVLQSSSNGNYSTDLATLKASSGWYVSLENTTTPTWVGEKGLAKTSIFKGVLYATTYTPPSQTTAQVTCSKDEGLGKLYALNVLNATAVYDYTGDGTITSADRQYELGGGIPSELVIVIRSTGVSALVGTSGGAAMPPGIPKGSPRYRTFWFQE